MNSDAIIALIQLAFTAALLPTLRDTKARVPRYTSALTATGLWIIGVQYVYLGLRTAAAAAFLATIAWGLIFLLRPVRS